MNGSGASVVELESRLAELCPRHRLDLAGAVALPAALPHREAWLDWIAAGRHGGLEYLARDPEGRADPTRRDPWARSLLVFAQRYTDGWPADDQAARAGLGTGGPWTDGVARFARGLDYHDILLAAIEDVVDGLRGAWPSLVARAYVDTGPFLEREYALLAGLGFVGKNTCLIHETLGSGLFLGVALTNLELRDLAPGPLYAVTPRARRGRCGSCTRCLDACPTGALAAPYVLDANICLSTWTIEWRGRAPADARARQGGLVFGCDICQAVCPWNTRAARAAQESPIAPPPATDYALDPAPEEVALADLVAIDAEQFGRRLRRTPLWRCRPEGLCRNLLVAAANAGRGEVLGRARELAAGGQDPGVREVAAWAAAHLAKET